MKFKVFISSVQREFAEERQKLAEYIRKDALLGKFFDVFLFEDAPACDVEARNLYLPEVEKSDVYLGILGSQFGNADADGISPTEREYDLATVRNIERLVFVKKCVRDPREERFLQKVQSDVVRKSFDTFEDLQLAVYAALVRVLENKGYIRVAPFDLAVDTNLTLEDVDDAKVRDYLARARDAKKISVPLDADASWLLAKLGMIDSDGRLTNAGVLFFAKHPQQSFDSSVVKCLQYWGTHVERPIPSYQTYEDGIIGMIESALAFVMGRIDRTIGIPDERGLAAAQDELPRMAVREAIVNAVCHRDYESNGTVQIMLFRDRLEIMNPGTLPLGWTADTLLTTHESVARNKVIAKALDWAGYVERSGHGTEFIIEKCEAQGLATPQYRPDAAIFHTIIWRKTNERANAYRKDKSVGLVAHQVAQEVAHQVAYQNIPRNTAGRVFLILKDGPLGRVDIANAVGVTRMARSLKMALDMLLEDGLIEYTIPNNIRSRFQKYRLTEKGRQMLAR
jgi:predicted HTH transcriptional regulator